MIEFKTNKGEFVVYEMGITELAMCKFFNNPKMLIHGIHLQPLFMLSEATEEDAKLVVDDLRSEDYKYTDSLESLHSLLKSKGIDINNGNWYLFKKL